jgi:hypothetical protein
MVHDTPIATVGELITALHRYDPTTPVRIASQPSWPFENTIGQVVGTPQDADGDTAPTEPAVVWLAEGTQVGYLPEAAATALGWT